MRLCKTNCQRCGRKLTNPKSIALGYGPKCYRMLQWDKPVVDTKDEITFLKMEVKMLKRQIKELKISGVKHDVAIERIERDVIPISTLEGKLKVAVSKELKSIFSDPDWKAKLLINVNDLNIVREVV